MYLQIKQRVLTIGDNYYVYDEKDRVRYVVEEQVFSLRHQLNVYDYKSQKLVGCLKQEFLRLLPAFRIYMGGEDMGEVYRSFSLFLPRYELDFRNWRVEGDILGWDYRVMQEELEVMSISKKPMSMGDTYVLRYGNEDHALPGLLIVLAIDAANRSK